MPGPKFAMGSKENIQERKQTPVKEKSKLHVTMSSTYCQPIINTNISYSDLLALEDDEGKNSS